MTLLDLDDLLDKESSWRKKELFQCITSINATEGSAQRMALRAGVSLLYAHWEGWIKACGRAYLEYVNSQRLPLSSLNSSLLGAGLKSQISALESTHKSELHTKFASFIQSDAMNEFQKISSDLIRAESNLSDKLFEEMLTRLGVDKSWYELRFPLIEELRTMRNKVAHGEYAPVRPGVYQQLHTGILDICLQFDKEVRKMATSESYLKNH